jgi:hypothetical protein
MATVADNILLGAMQAKLTVAKNDLAAALVHHSITPTASITAAASNVSIMRPITISTMVSNARIYCWTHDNTINIWHNSATCCNKRPWHHNDEIETNKWGGSMHVCGGAGVWTRGAVKSLASSKIV